MVVVFLTWKQRHGATMFDAIASSFLPLGCVGVKKKPETVSNTAHVNTSKPKHVAVTDP